jgi:nucleoside-diphosphate-sugar epimerase
VEDVVAVNLDFLDHPERSGIFNVGSGRAATFNSIAAATINACRAAASEPPRPLGALVADGVITYIRLPPRWPASTRASPKPISRGFAPPATPRRCARST